MRGGARGLCTPVRPPPPWLATVFLVTALLSAPWHGHVDDVDGQLYQVVARHMVRDGTWTLLRYLPDVHPQFREHLPFGLWPYALGIRVMGELSLPLLAALFTLLTVLCAGWMARKLGGPASGVLAMVVLGTCESVFSYGGRPRLDPPLMLFALAAAAPWVRTPITAPGWLLSAAFAAGAVAVKGPFGVLPLIGIVVGRAAFAGKGALKLLAAGVACCAVASLPVGAWLLHNHLAGDDSWWVGYLQHQVLASATGARTDGSANVFQPVLFVLQRFWPGLPLVGLAAYRAFTRPDERALRSLLVASLVVLVVLCVPGRKVWNHTLVLFPLLAVTGAVACEPWLQRHAGLLRAALPALAMLVTLGSAAGLGRNLLPAPCAPSSIFVSTFKNVRPGEDVVVVSTTPDWRMLASLAAEWDVVPRPRAALDDGGNARVALAREESLPDIPPGWRDSGRGQGWVLLTRL